MANLQEGRMLLDYLYKNFVTETEFCHQAKICKQQLIDLQKAKLIPLASYKLEVNLDCQSFTGKFKQTANYHFYHPNYINWYQLTLLHHITNKQSAMAMFQTAYETAQQDFICSDSGTQIIQIYDSKQWALNSIEETWQHFTNGTYGLCTVSGLPNHIFLKHIHGEFIKYIISKNSPHEISTGDAKLLNSSVNILDEVTAPFADHERKTTSRQLNIINVRKQYFNL